MRTVDNCCCIFLDSSILLFRHLRSGRLVHAGGVRNTNLEVSGQANGIVQVYLSNVGSFLPERCQLAAACYMFRAGFMKQTRHCCSI